MMEFIAVCQYDGLDEFSFFSTSFWIEAWDDLETAGEAAVKSEWAKICPYPAPKILRFEPGVLIHSRGRGDRAGKAYRPPAQGIDR